MSPDAINTMKTAFEIAGYQVLCAEGEADLLLSNTGLEKGGICVISFDSDFAFRRGITLWWRPRFRDGKLFVQTIDREEALCSLGLTESKLVALAILSGNDYTQRTVHGVGMMKCLDELKKASVEGSFWKMVEAVCAKKDLVLDDFVTAHASFALNTETLDIDPWPSQTDFLAFSTAELGAKPSRSSHPFREKPWQWFRRDRKARKEAKRYFREGASSFAYC